VYGLESINHTANIQRNSNARYIYDNSEQIAVSARAGTPLPAIPTQLRTI